MRYVDVFSGQVRIDGKEYGSADYPCYVNIDAKYAVTPREGAAQSYDVPDLRIDEGFSCMNVSCSAEEKCKNCKYCKRLYVPVLPCYDHARNVRDRYVCTALDDSVMYLGDDESQCEMFEVKNEDKPK